MWNIYKLIVSFATVQGANERVMLAAMLRAAVNWMRAGLPLQLLKIVIYTRGDSIQDSDKLIEIFDAFKQKVEKLPRVPQVSDYWPLYLVYYKWVTNSLYTMWIFLIHCLFSVILLVVYDIFLIHCLCSMIKIVVYIRLLPDSLFVLCDSDCCLLHFPDLLFVFYDQGCCLRHLLDSLFVFC